MGSSGVERIIVEGLGRLPQFSHAARIGDTLHVSGTLGTTEGLVLAEGVAAQTTQTLTNIGRILDEAGASWSDVAKVNVYLHDMVDFAAMNAAYGAFFDDVPPARITVGGAVLALDALVEIDCVAAVPAPVAPTMERSRRPRLARRSGHVEHDGESIFFEVLGDGGVPMVLSHGAGGNHSVWFQQAAHFASDRTVIVWDHRGYGRSTDHAGLSGTAVASLDLLAVLDHLGIEQADLVGQSMGGWTSVGAVIERPSIVRRLVLADTLGGLTDPAIDSATEQWRQGRSADTAVADHTATLGLHPAIDASLWERDPALAHLYQQLAESSRVDIADLVPRLMAQHRPLAEVRDALACPVLCVVGERDDLFAPPAVRALADLLPDGRCTEVPGTGHSPYFEDPEMWNLVVRRFLDS